MTGGYDVTLFLHYAAIFPYAGRKNIGAFVAVSVWTDKSHLLATLNTCSWTINGNLQNCARVPKCVRQ